MDSRNDEERNVFIRFLIAFFVNKILGIVCQPIYAE